MSQEGAKAPKKTRGAAALRTGKDPEEIFDWLYDRWAYDDLTPDKREALGFELLPYVKPKRKAVERSGNIDMVVNITIGGSNAG